MEILWTIVAIIALIVLGLVMYNVLRATTRIVPEGQRLVVYRLGRFHRVVGPGLVQVLPALEQATRTLEVRDHPLEVTVKGIFAYGVLNDLTLHLWCSYDLARAAAGSRAKLALFVQMSDSERRHQVEVKMREALVNQVAILEKQMPLASNSTPLEGVIALAPGTERYNKLLAGVKEELEKSLPSIGVVLNTAQSLTLTGRIIPDVIIEAIKRMQGRQIDSKWLTRYADELRQKFPDISSAVLDQMLASIDGVDVGNVQRLRLEQDDKTEAQVELEVPVDGSETPTVIAKPKIKLGEREAKVQVAATRSAAPSGPGTAAGLSKSDLSVLKRVPRNKKEERLSA
ncbi:MAG: SPFH domain-containing protein [Anaerolineae bacterium]